MVAGSSECSGSCCRVAVIVLVSVLLVVIAVVAVMVTAAKLSRSC